MTNFFMFTPKRIIISTIALLSLFGFGFLIYKNMGTKTKASGSGSVSVTYSNSVTGPIAAKSQFVLGVTMAANNNNKISGIDLSFENADDLLDYLLPDAITPLENQSTAAFNETIRLQYSTRSDGTKKLERLVMVAKKPTADLKSVATVRLRFKTRASLMSLPATSIFRINTGASLIVGPDINGNTYSFTPSDASTSLAFASICGGKSCAQGQVCYQDICREPCGANGSCNGSYRCVSGACVPNTSSSSRSIFRAATATPYPTKSPSKANLLFRVSIPDISTGTNLLSDVRVQVKDGGRAITEKMVVLQRKQGTDYFHTPFPVELDVPGKKQYTVLIKQLKTIRRSFKVTLQKGFTVDCASENPDSDCDSLKNPSLAPLLSGDTDGFNDGTNKTKRSDSFNKIDAADLERLNSTYGANPLPAEPNSDLNLDGKIDVTDLGILGKNFDKTGE